MRDVALAVIISVLVSAGISYWMVRQVREDQASLVAQSTRQSDAIDQLDRRRAPTVIFTQVSPSGGTCVSTTDVKRESEGPGEVHWVVRWVGNNVGALCRNDHTVLIRPKPGNTSPLTPAQPFAQHLIKASHGNTPGSYFYEVWMASSNGTPLYMMEDPELEIIETRFALAQ